MSVRPPDQFRGFGFLIADINRLMRKEFDRRVRHLGLTRAQWLFLSHLSRQPGCTQSDLAEVLQLEKITVSRQAARLEKAGWIARNDHASDGRAYHLHLTPKAQRMIDRLTEAAARLRGDYLRGLPASRRLALQDDLLRIKRNLLALQNAGRPAPVLHEES